MREVDVPQAADRGYHRCRAGQGKDDVRDLRKQDRLLVLALLRKPNEPELPAHCILDKLEDRPCVLLDEREKDGLGHVCAAVPYGVQLLEARGAGEGKDMRLVLKHD